MMYYAVTKVSDIIADKKCEIKMCLIFLSNDSRQLFSSKIGTFYFFDFSSNAIIRIFVAKQFRKI